MIYGSETGAGILAVAQRKIKQIMFGITLIDSKGADLDLTVDWSE